MELEFPEGPFGGLLFDCDGTIANSLPVHYESWLEAIAPYGISFPKELFLAWGGIPVPRTVEMMNERFQTSMPVEAVTHAREEAYARRLLTVKAHEAVEREIKRHHGKLPMAVVSGGPRASVQKTLQHLQLLPYFDVLVTAEDCTRGKPDPQPFLIAAERLGVRPESCLVFEDAEPGVQAALAAGMKVIRIPQILD